MAKYRPKYNFSIAKVDVEQSDVTAVVFRQRFAANEGCWLRHVTKRATTRPSSSAQLVAWRIIPSSVKNISKRLRLWINSHNFFDFIRRSKLDDVITRPSVCP